MLAAMFGSLCGRIADRLALAVQVTLRWLGDRFVLAIQVALQSLYIDCAMAVQTAFQSIELVVTKGKAGPRFVTGTGLVLFSDELA